MGLDLKKTALAGVTALGITMAPTGASALTCALEQPRNLNSVETAVDALTTRAGHHQVSLGGEDAVKIGDRNELKQQAESFSGLDALVSSKKIHIDPVVLVGCNGDKLANIQDSLKNDTGRTQYYRLAASSANKLMEKQAGHIEAAPENEGPKDYTLLQPKPASSEYPRSPAMHPVHPDYIKMKPRQAEWVKQPELKQPAWIVQSQSETLKPQAVSEPLQPKAAPEALSPKEVKLELLKPKAHPALLRPSGP